MSGPGTALRVALAACLLLVVLLIGTEAGRLLTPVRAIGSLLGAGLILHYLVAAPRHHDTVDALVAAALAVFLVTCVTSSDRRLSFEAAITAFAYAGAFYAARGAVAGFRGRGVAVNTLGALGTLLALLFLWGWAGLWAEWMAIVGPGIPPLDLNLPSAPYAGIHVAILMGLLLPAILLLAGRRGMWPLGIVGGISCLAVILMSGSRSAWLGLAVATLTAVAVGVRGRLRMRPRVALAAVTALLVGGSGLAVVGGPQLLERLATGSTVDLRLAMWSESIGHWLKLPLVGAGPGTFPAQIGLTQYNNHFEPWVTHAHNAFVQVLFESGLVGALAIGLLAAAVIIGLRRSSDAGWAPIMALTFALVVSLTENPTINPYLIAPLIAWTALAMPRVAGETRQPSTLVRGANLSMAAAAGLAVAATLAASFAYDRASQAADAGARGEVLGALETSVALDPSFAFYQRELGVWLMAEGRLEAARAALDRAIALNPADPAALRASAVLGLGSDDPQQALAVAQSIVERAGLHAENALTLAYVGQSTGNSEALEAGVVRAVRLAPWILAAPGWDEHFPATDKSAVLAAAWEAWRDADDPSARNARARTWLSVLAGGGRVVDGAAAEAEAAMLRCEPELAEEALGALNSAQAADASALQARLMYERAFGGSSEEDLLTLLAAHDPGVLRIASQPIAGLSAVGDHNRDVGTYYRIPIRPPIGPMLPTPASGLSAWLRDPIAAADVGAPGSGLAICR